MRRRSHIAKLMAFCVSFAALFLIFSPGTRGEFAQGASIWSGVYTDQQAERGKRVHAAVCSQCHGLRLDGANQPDMPQAPPIARNPFIQKWEGKSLGGLFQLIKATMPTTAPGSLTDQQYIDAIAYMLKVTGTPSGGGELPLSSKDLAGIVIGPKP